MVAEARRNEKETVQVIKLLFLSAISGFLYYMGGQIQTKIRDFGVPTMATISLFVLGIHNPIVLFFNFGLLFASLTTYCKKKGEDATWLSWLLTGVLYGLSASPICIVTEHWIGFILRTLFLGGSLIAISKLNRVEIEEPARGFLIIITLPLLWV